MDAPIVALLIKFIASDPSRCADLTVWLLTSDEIDQDVKEIVKKFVLRFISKGEQSLAAFEEVAAKAWRESDGGAA